MSTSTAGGRRRSTPSERAENRAGLAFVSPTLLVVLVIVVVPIIWTVLLAFQHAKLIDLQGMGLFGNWTSHNFEQVFTAPGFWSSLTTTLIYTVGGTVGSIVLGLIAALALRRPFRGRGVVRSTMLLPYVAPVVAVTFVWETALSPQTGIINNWGTHVFGWRKPIAFLSTSSYPVDLLGWHLHLPLALLTVVAFEIWRYFPFAFLFLLARLQAVPAGIEEAAEVDGATLTQRFRHILLPQLMPVIALLSVLRFIMTFNKFDDIYLLTGGNSGTEVVSVRVYNFLTASYDVGAAAAQALVLAVILMVLLGIYFGFFAKRVQEEQA
ncbi:carbohydrate ABC transporter permease [Actinacidiphila sp. bgisy145]|uniref:carbohydrate ABC transporter permease n=1 Tax=Actinacidiphila sp. bgisy145 TaxID=3413792 RepID=UPI003EBC83BD